MGTPGVRIGAARVGSRAVVDRASRISGAPRLLRRRGRPRARASRAVAAGPLSRGGRIGPPA
jgi:hypothetical protein